LFAALAFAFAPAASAQPKPAEKPITVFAAASLTDALDAVGAAYVKAGHSKPVFSYAASSSLARQIEQGARADLFISADEEWMDYLAQRKLIIAGTRVSLLGNALVLVAPAGSAMNVKIEPGFNLAGALGAGKLAMADPESVPAGKYGRAALQALGAWNGVEASVARGENVRAALRFVETGDAAAGIVYLTDAKASGDKVKVVGTFPATSHPKISYPMAEVKGAAAGARAFAAFLRSPAAKAIFRAQGFVVP
jgi:molybdate transport system substrate-binding protein